MSIRCVNPECFYGDPGDPPEYVSDNGRECTGCMAFVDLDDEDYTETVDEHGRAGIRCAECRERCQGVCGEYVVDYAQAVRLRCPVTGKLELYCSGDCAATEWLTRLLHYRSDMAGRHDADLAAALWRYDPDDLTREDLAGLVKFHGRERERGPVAAR
jgi:hypothetical protein